MYLATTFNSVVFVKLLWTAGHIPISKFAFGNWSKKKMVSMFQSSRHFFRHHYGNICQLSLYNEETLLLLSGRHQRCTVRHREHWLDPLLQRHRRWSPLQPPVSHDGFGGFSITRDCDHSRNNQMHNSGMDASHEQRYAPRMDALLPLQARSYYACNWKTFSFIRLIQVR